MLENNGIPSDELCGHKSRLCRQRNVRKSRKKLRGDNRRSSDAKINPSGVIDRTGSQQPEKHAHTRGRRGPRDNENRRFCPTSEAVNEIL